MRRLRIVAAVAICATLLVSACSGGSATVTGTLAGADGACLYVLVSNGSGTDRYWLRQLPTGYDTADEQGLHAPDGRFIKMGHSLTVTGTLTWDPFQGNCAGGHTLDAATID